jgi:hypothetical protein
MSALQRRLEKLEHRRGAGCRLTRFVMRAPGAPMPELPDDAPLFVLVMRERDRGTRTS